MCMPLLTSHYLFQLINRWMIDHWKRWIELYLVSGFSECTNEWWCKRENVAKNRTVDSKRAAGSSWRLRSIRCCSCGHLTVHCKPWKQGLCLFWAAAAASCTRWLPRTIVPFPAWSDWYVLAWIKVVLMTLIVTLFMAFVFGASPTWNLQMS